MSTTQQSDWKKSFDFTPNSKSKKYVNTTCSSSFLPESVFTKRKEVKIDAQGHKTVIVEGKDLVFSKGDAMFDAISTKDKTISSASPDVLMQNLIITCDTLTLNDELRVPECNVSIFARKFIVEKNGSINTSPLPWDLEKAEDANSASDEIDDSRNGTDGRHGGNINLFVHTLENKNTGTLFNLNGGNGQSAGHGFDGKDGKSIYPSYGNIFSHVERGVFSDDKTTFEISFDTLCYGYKYEWYYFSTSNPSWKYWPEGQRNPAHPTSGTNAKKPGKPGEPGNSGQLKSNLDASLLNNTNKAGSAGTKARNVSGGSAGYPCKSAYYQIQMKIRKASSGATEESSVKKVGNTIETKDGKSYTAPSTNKQSGDTPSFSKVNTSNAWLHPRQLRILLNYVRGAFLSDGGDANRKKLSDILSVYDEALKNTFPPLDIWDERGIQTYNESKQKISALLSKLKGGKDYYGHVAGYMPVLSLSSTISLYKNNLDDALQRLVLAKWLAFSYEKSTEATNIINVVLEKLRKDNENLVSETQKLEKNIKTLDTKLDGVNSKMEKLKDDLLRIEGRLMAETQKELKKQAEIKFALKMGAAITQLIPYGQPALGMVGSIANSIADNYGEDFATQAGGVADVFSKNKLGDTLVKTKKGLNEGKKAVKNQQKAANAMSNSKNKDIVVLLEQAGVDVDESGISAHRSRAKIVIPGKKEEKKKKPEKASKWTELGNNLGPAMGTALDAFKALSVPESEIMAAANKLKSTDKEWNEAIKEIKKFTKEKGKLFSRIIETINRMAVVSSQLQKNALIGIQLQGSLGGQADLADEDLMNFANELAEDTKDQLIYQLYLMVKAYETSVFKPLPIRWADDNLFDKVLDNIKNNGDFSIDKVKNIAATLKPLLTRSLSTVSKKLRDFLNDRENQLKITTSYLAFSDGTLAEHREPKNEAYLNILNETKSLEFNPFTFFHIDPYFHFMRIKSIELEDIIFNQAVTDDELLNSKIELTVRGEGQVRANTDLFTVRGGRQKYSWSATTGGKWKKDELSHTINDFFNQILNEVKEGERAQVQRMAMLPAWSDMRLELRFRGKLNNKKVAYVKLKFEYEYKDAPTDQYVFDLRSYNASGEFQIEGLGGKNYQVNGDFYHVTESDGKVKVTASDQVNDIKFGKWYINKKGADRIEVKDKTIEVDMENLLYLECVYGQLEERVLPSLYMGNPVAKKTAQPDEDQPKKVDAKKRRDTPKQYNEKNNPSNLSNSSNEEWNNNEFDFNDDDYDDDFEDF